MFLLLRIAILSVIFIVLLRLKLPVGFSFLALSFLWALFFSMPLLSFSRSLFLTIFSFSTIRLYVVVYLIALIGIMLKQTGEADAIVESVSRLFREPRPAVTILPAVIGLLPMPGGAVFSAPLFEKSAAVFSLPPEEKLVINYWFRHLWEYCWPLYPGLILASEMLDVPVTCLMASQFPFTLFMILLGLIFFILPLPRIGAKRDGKVSFRDILNFLLRLWFVWVIIVCSVLGGVDIAVALALISIVFLVMLLLRKALSSKLFFSILKDAFSFEILVLVLSVMVFKRVIEASGALDGLPTVLSALGLPELFILFIIPFFLGLVTGVNFAYIGISFAVVLPIISGNLPLAAFVYSSGFTGVLLSPVHLCLALSKIYFGADWGKIYKLLFLPVSLLIVFSFIFLLVH